MLTLVQLAVLALGFSFYPSFGDEPSPHIDQRVEAAIDKGPIYEIIVSCGEGTAILSYSKVEKLFCTAYGGCMAGQSLAISEACRE